MFLLTVTKLDANSKVAFQFFFSSFSLLLLFLFLFLVSVEMMAHTRIVTRTQIIDAFRPVIIMHYYFCYDEISTEFFCIFFILHCSRCDFFRLWYAIFFFFLEKCTRRVWFVLISRNRFYSHFSCLSSEWNGKAHDSIMRRDKKIIAKYLLYVSLLCLKLWCTFFISALLLVVACHTQVFESKN